MPEMTHADYLSTLRERFGDNPADWAFVCPGCGDVATGADFKAALTEHSRTDRWGQPVRADQIMGQECIGRTVGALDGPADQYKGRGCDWCAYGLIQGPLIVVTDDGKRISSFEPAPAPETT